MSSINRVEEYKKWTKWRELPICLYKNFKKIDLRVKIYIFLPSTQENSCQNSHNI